MRLSNYILFVIMLGSGFSYSLFGQKVRIQLGPDKIGSNQVWTITATVENHPLKSYRGFPDIKGFRKGNTSTQSQTSIVNGQVSSSQSITLQYFATREGVFTLNPFKMNINGQVIASAGKTIQVTAPVKQQHHNDPFSNFFNRNSMNDVFEKESTEFIDIKENAFLALTTNKKKVYVKEGFTATLSFLVAEDNRAPMQFHELGKQLSRILKKIKPTNCWEENFNIENVRGEPINIKGKRYTQYTIYQAAFYPLNDQSIHFPRIGLEMIKFKVAKNPSFFGQNRKQDYKTFYTKPKTINVKQLPPHPLSESVSVGDYHLNETLDAASVEAGQSIAYNFNIYGEGNISAIKKPQINESDDFDFYEPNMKQRIQRMNGRVVGTKSFHYYIIPKEPGTYALGDYFKWIFFNPKARKYDTLRAKKTIRVTGESQKNRIIASTDNEALYDIIGDASNRLTIASGRDWLKTGANIFIVLTLIVAVAMVFKK